MGEHDDLTPAQMLLSMHRDTREEIRLLREQTAEQAKATTALGVQVNHLAKSIEAQNAISIKVDDLEKRMVSQENYRYRLAAWASVWTIVLVAVWNIAEKVL